MSFEDNYIGDIDEDGIGLDVSSVSYDDYAHSDGDEFVITIRLGADIGTFEEGNDPLLEGNPLKRVSQVGIKGGKRVRKLVKSSKKGFRRGSDGKTKKQKGSEKIARARGSRRAKQKNKGKMAVRVRKFKKSAKKSRRIKNRATRRT